MTVMLLLAAELPLLPLIIIIRPAVLANTGSSRLPPGEGPFNTIGEFIINKDFSMSNQLASL